MLKESVSHSVSSQTSNRSKFNWKGLSLLGLASTWLPGVRAQAQDFEYNFLADRMTPLDQKWSIQHEGYTRGSWQLTYNQDIPWLSNISTYAHPNPERNFVKKLNRLQAYHPAPIFGFPSQVCNIEHLVNEARHPVKLYSMRVTGLNAAIPELCYELKEVLSDPFPALSDYFKDLDKTHVLRSRLDSVNIVGAFIGLGAAVTTASLILFCRFINEQKLDLEVAQPVSITEPELTLEPDLAEEASESSFELVEHLPAQLTHLYRTHRSRQRAITECDAGPVNTLVSMTPATNRETRHKQLTA